MIQILISTMFLRDYRELLQKMNISTDAVIINQCDENSEYHVTFDGHNILIINTTERGLSKSRNMAVSKSSAKYLIFADDDFRYSDDYAHMVKEAYMKYPCADAVIFRAIRKSSRIHREFKNGKLSKYYQFSVNSVRITVKRSVIIEKNIFFDEYFGSGARVSHGEDTIFISECFKQGVNFYSANTILCTEFDEGRQSTWWQGYTEQFFKDKGTLFKRLSKNYLLLIMYFVVKHRLKYRKFFSMREVVSLMLEGTKVHYE